jgi:Protein of unknown function (DUF2849)
MTSPLDQKIKITGPVVITANRLADGAVIYRTADGGWTTQLGDAAISTSAAVVQQALAAANGDELRAVGAYVAPVKIAGHDNVHPGNLRELIRSGGPTIDFQGTR